MISDASVTILILPAKNLCRSDRAVRSHLSKYSACRKCMRSLNSVNVTQLSRCKGIPYNTSKTSHLLPFFDCHASRYDNCIKWREGTGYWVQLINVSMGVNTIQLLHILNDDYVKNVKVSSSVTCACPLA